MPKGYNMVAWREDMVKKIFLACGVDASNLVFLFSDTQIINEAFVEDINNILNNGEIPNLYKADDLVQIIESVKEAKKNDPEFRDISDDNNKIKDLFAT
jgi:dynein heavy chain